jgi:hypothetical protein
LLTPKMLPTYEAWKEKSGDPGSTLWAVIQWSLQLQPLDGPRSGELRIGGSRLVQGTPRCLCKRTTRPGPPPRSESTAAPLRDCRPSDELRLGSFFSQLIDGDEQRAEGSAEHDAALHHSAIQDEIL